MIRHIVLWRFPESSAGATRADNLLKARSMLLALKGKIPEILSLEVEPGVMHESASSHLVLNGTFRSVADLETYQRHPEHVSVVHFLRAVQSEKAVVDYELPGGQ